MKDSKHKLLIIISVVVIIIGGIGLFALSNNKKESKIEPRVKDLPLKVDSTPLNFNIVESEAGPVLEATFKNNSKEDITRIVLEVKLKDTGETIELRCDEMVAKGATSPKFTGKAPASGKVEDVEVLKYKISLKSGVYMEYDEKLKQYNWS